MILRRIGLMIGAWLAFVAAASIGHAQETFPNRPVRIVIPYSPGRVADVFARIVGQNMAEQWKGSIVVESKSGANGSIAAEEVARAAPDGYTWLLVTTFFTASPSRRHHGGLRRLGSPKRRHRRHERAQNRIAGVTMALSMFPRTSNTSYIPTDWSPV